VKHLIPTFPFPHPESRPNHRASRFELFEYQHRRAKGTLNFSKSAKTRRFPNQQCLLPWCFAKFQRRFARLNPPLYFPTPVTGSGTCFCNLVFTKSNGKLINNAKNAATNAAPNVAACLFPEVTVPIAPCSRTKASEFPASWPTFKAMARMTVGREPRKRPERPSAFMIEERALKTPV